MFLGATLPAQALSTYDFSFSSVEGAVAGTVAGSITLPDGDGVFAASAVQITSAPGLLGLTTPIDAMQSGTLFNVFTVVGGQIDPLNSSFLAFFATDTSIGLLGGPSAETYLDRSGIADLGASGVLDVGSATLQFNSVPEVSGAWGAVGVGVAAFGLRQWKRRSAQG